MAAVVALVAGLVFGIGLLVSGMANPAKVLAFLDIGGRWDPSLALVMAGAVGVGLVAFGIARRRSVFWLGAAMPPPPSGGVDARLVGGSLLFGIGWGLAGFCPGPALVSLSAGGHAKALVFVVAMLAGMGLFDLLDRRRNASAAQPS